jgi:hypothetical protein
MSTEIEQSGTGGLNVVGDNKYFPKDSHFLFLIHCVIKSAENTAKCELCQLKRKYFFEFSKFNFKLTLIFQEKEFYCLVVGCADELENKYLAECSDDAIFPPYFTVNHT